MLAATSFLMDQLIRVIFDFADQRIYAAANPSAAERLTLTIVAGPLSLHAGRAGCSSAWLERLVRDQEVAGSNPVTPT